MAEKVKELTGKQQRFVEEYLIDLNATQAAIRAGYSAKTAKSIGQENLTKPDIAKALAQAKVKRAEKTGITAERVLEELAAIAFFNWKAITEADEEGRLRLSDCREWPDEAFRVLTQCDRDENTVGEAEVNVKIRVKTHDKMNALVTLLKHTMGTTDDEEKAQQAGMGLANLIMRGLSEQQKMESRKAKRR